MTNDAVALYRTVRSVVHVAYDSSMRKSPAETVIDAVATAADCEPTDLPPLYTAIDPDVVEDLIAHPVETTDGTAILSFSIDNWMVFVGSEGQICICDSHRSVEPTPVFGHGSR